MVTVVNIANYYQQNILGETVRENVYHAWQNAKSDT